jgi:N-acetylglucosaminyl-diphospho-decaprenol L-rhamnosyltransferase
LSATTAAVIVHFGDWEPTRRAVLSLAHHAPDVRVTIVNNDPESVPPNDLGADILFPNANLGYGAACNLGARVGSDDYLLFANNDVEVLAGTVAALRAALDRDAGAAAAGPLFLDGSGRVRRSLRLAPTPWRIWCENLFLARLLAPIPFFRGHHTVFADESRSRHVETLLGALFLIRRAAFDAVSGFDESYFFYAEESDLFARLRLAGWSLRFEPKARAIHHDGVASRQVPRRVLDRWLHEGLLRYARRFHGQRGERRAARALTAGAALRWLLSWVPGLPDRIARRSRYGEILRAGRDRNRS